MAMTAWSANVMSSEICRSSKGLESGWAAPIAPMTCPWWIMGTKMTESNPNSRAKSWVADGAAGFPITGANWAARFDSIASPPTVVSSRRRG